MASYKHNFNMAITCNLYALKTLKQCSYKVFVITP